MGMDSLGCRGIEPGGGDATSGRTADGHAEVELEATIAETGATVAGREASSDAEPS